MSSVPLRRLHGPHAPRLLVAIFVALALAFPRGSHGALGASPGSDLGAVATEHELATRAAADVLRAGGHAADAAVAAALVLGVVSPVSSGIGGGGFALVWDAAARRATALDFRETAPRAIDPRSLDTRPVPDALRGVLVGVPGEVAGFAQLHRRWGRLPLAHDAAAAIRSAEHGFAVGPHLARMLGLHAGAVIASPQLRALFGRTGVVAGQGVVVSRPALARTLRRVASGGERAFYDGPVAGDLVRAARARGSRIQARDLCDYRVVERAPLPIAWEGSTLLTMPPPSAGGVLLAQTLATFDRASLRALGHGSAGYLHALAESFRGSLADRVHSMGDPAFVAVSTDALVSPAHIRARRARFGADLTHAPARFQMPEHGTSHVVVVDGRRNVVSLTTTVNGPFGSRIVAPESGVLLNDELDDFTPPSTAAAFGLRDAGPNAPRPGARPVSSMTPVIVLRDGEPVAAAGGSGGARIAPNVTQVLLRLLAFDASVGQAVDAPRFSIAFDSPALVLEQPAPEPAVLQDLADRGEQVRFSDYPAAVQAVTIGRGGAAGRLEAHADPRKYGSAVVIPAP
jgi:gamma-glutamyltranspeptidase/glutathione hydrolase